MAFSRKIGLGIPKKSLGGGEPCASPPQGARIDTPQGDAMTSRRRRPPKAPGSSMDEPFSDMGPAGDDATLRTLIPPFPIVAIGASAGGLEAFTRLLGSLPANTGMAFVVLQHLSPAHESMLSEILGRATPMPVAEAREDMPVERDHVYVMPPGKDMAFADGHLRLAPRGESR